MLRSAVVLGGRLCFTGMTGLSNRYARCNQGRAAVHDFSRSKRKDGTDDDRGRCRRGGRECSLRHCFRSRCSGRGAYRSCLPRHAPRQAHGCFSGGEKALIALPGEKQPLPHGHLKSTLVPRARLSRHKGREHPRLSNHTKPNPCRNRPSTHPHRAWPICVSSRVHQSARILQQQSTEGPSLTNKHSRSRMSGWHASRGPRRRCSICQLREG